MDGPCGRRACNELDTPWRVESAPAVTAGGLVTPTGTSTKRNVKTVKTKLDLLLLEKTLPKLFLFVCVSLVFHFELIKKLGRVNFYLQNNPQIKCVRIIS